MHVTPSKVKSLGKTVLADMVAVPKISSGIQASPSFAIATELIHFHQSPWWQLELQPSHVHSRQKEDEKLQR